MKQTLIFISSYFDFVRVRNYFRKRKFSFGVCCEYSKRSELDRARTYFKQGRIQYLITTERFYFFRRYRIRGTRHVVFYTPPKIPQFYADIVNSMPSSSLTDSTAESSVTVLFDRYDSLQLEGIAGTSRCRRMLKKEDKLVFLFC